MADRSRRRAASARIRGRRRTAYLAERLGRAIRAARTAAGLTQQELGARAGVSQSWLSEAERGLAPDATVETWASLGAALHLQLAAFFELAPGSSPPRDVEHLRRQQLVIETAAPGAWHGRPEVQVITADGVSRSIDVILERARAWGKEIAIVEIVDLFADVGEDLRGLERKVEAIRTARPDAVVRGLLVVRATARNRAVVAELRSLFAARFPASGQGWLAALGSAGSPAPDTDGLLWSASRGGALFAPRLTRRGSTPPRRLRPPGRGASDS